MGTAEDTNTEWHGDILNRRQYALFLTSYLTSKDTPFVINLNASWGAGKTFFINNWNEEIKENHPTVLFNAWKNDYSNDPFLSVISCINKSLIPLIPDTNTAENSAKSFFSTSGRLLKQVAPILAKGAISKLVGEGGLDELSNINTEDETSIVELAGSITEKLIDENTAIEQAATDFQISLTTIIEQATTNGLLSTPLFVFIDELDRCRPLYAIELLERIKHLFDIPNIVFVVATDTEQLSHSVKAIYGKGFDAEVYLKRFFDQTYSLPSPNNIEFSKLLFKNFKQDISFLHYGIGITGEDISSQHQNPSAYIPKNENTLTIEPQSHAELILLFTLFSEMFNLDLRSQKQCFEKFLAILSTCNKEHEIHFAYLIFLIMLDSKNPALFEGYFTHIDNNSNHPRHYEITKKYISFFYIRKNTKLYQAANLIEFYSNNAFLTSQKIRKLLNSGHSKNSDWLMSLYDNHVYISKYKEMVLLAGSLS